MLKIVVYVNEREIARAHAGNVSEDIRGLCDYEVRVNERQSEQLGIEEKAVRFEISQHDREQTVWSLVEKIASMWLEETGARQPRTKADDVTRAFLKLKKAKFLAGQVPLSDPITSAEELDALAADVEVGPLTRALLALKEAGIALGRAKLSDPISADEIRARKVHEESDNELLSQIRASIRELDERITSEVNGDDQSEDEHTDPALEAFLELLEKDIAAGNLVGDLAEHIAAHKRRLGDDDDQDN
ncbi:hypothetical protein [Ruegeria profundi]|uniref:Uncharacterized protein n=1 Tax=Ruegeria profundi TaxID=1685378 RepID=A0A0X3TTK6_9RHOB|nr:hypothetical protein [Ruegeria profundi]KUJ77806.1 hypothetical protein AVO44_15905 [Ruegeria profundi]